MQVYETNDDGEMDYKGDVIFIYGMKLEMPSKVTTLKGFVRFENNRRIYPEIVAFDRRLTNEEISRYELIYIGEKIEWL